MAVRSKANGRLHVALLQLQPSLGIQHTGFRRRSSQRPRDQRETVVPVAALPRVRR